MQKDNLKNPTLTDAKPMLAVRCNLSKDDEIALYEKFLDEFTDKDGLMKPCNLDAIFNWFGWKLWRSNQ
jgi:hypothetical protein